MNERSNEKIARGIIEAKCFVLRDALSTIFHLPTRVIRIGDRVELVFQDNLWWDARRQVQQALACCQVEHLTAEMISLIWHILEWMDFINGGSHVSGQILISSPSVSADYYDNLRHRTEDLLK